MSSKTDTKNSIFVISPIGKSDEDGVDFTEIFMEQIVIPAAARAGGFSTPLRADKVNAPGSISASIVKDIVRADVCVADLTGRNPNVMYEVAIAHAADKPVILLQQEQGGGPFDFSHERVIRYGLRVDEANAAMKLLAEHLLHANDDQEDNFLKATMNPVRSIFKQISVEAKADDADKYILRLLEDLAKKVDALGVQYPSRKTNTEQKNRIQTNNTLDVLNILSRIGENILEAEGLDYETVKTVFEKRSSFLEILKDPISRGIYEDARLEIERLRKISQGAPMSQVQLNEVERTLDEIMAYVPPF